MVRLAVSGHEITVDDDQIEGLSPARTGTPKVRSCWSATTGDYAPVLVLELSGGLMIARSAAWGDAGEFPASALPWARIASIRQVEPDWMMVLALTDGTAISLLFASVGELHRVAAQVTESWASARLGAGYAGAAPTLPMPEPESAPDRAEGAHGSGHCSEPSRAMVHGHPRRRVRGAHQPSPTLDRIERRLASVETLLADLTTATHARGS